MKSVGGITHGRSTTDSVKAQWILGTAVNLFENHSYSNTGIVGDPIKVQCYKAYKFGNKSMSTSIGQTYTNLKLKKGNMAKSLATLTNSIPVGPQIESHRTLGVVSTDMCITT